jgi:hypothetical protein
LLCIIENLKTLFEKVMDEEDDIEEEEKRNER